MKMMTISISTVKSKAPGKLRIERDTRVILACLSHAYLVLILQNTTKNEKAKRISGHALILIPRRLRVVSELSPTAVTTFEPAGKDPFIYSYLLTRLMGQCNETSPISLVYVLKPMIPAITAISARKKREDKNTHTRGKENTPHEGSNFRRGTRVALCFLSRDLRRELMKTNIAACKELFQGSGLDLLSGRPFSSFKGTVHYSYNYALFPKFVCLFYLLFVAEEIKVEIRLVFPLSQQSNEEFLSSLTVI